MMICLKNSSEIMLDLTEELGEVAQEVALLEMIGTKKNWEKLGDRERLKKEIGDVRNLLNRLEEYYKIIFLQAIIFFNL